MSENLNVCLCNDSFPPCIDGVANAVVNYAEAITREHGKCVVATPYYPDADDSAFSFPVVRYPSLNTSRLVGYRTGLPFSGITAAKLEQQNYNLIHSHCPIMSTVLARVLRDMRSAPLVLTYHTKFDIDIANAVRSKHLQAEAARVLVQNISACDEVWVVSEGAGKNLRSLGYDGDYIVMPNGVDLPCERINQSAVEEETKRYDLGEGVPVFLFVGRMMWYKGLHIILDALRAAAETGQDFRMVFIGGGGDEDEVHAEAEKLGLSDKCLFIGPIHERERIRAWYCRADLFLFPSTFDTNGLVVREAAACALPSVLIGGSCAAEGVRHGESGFLIEENAESMARLLGELCQQRDTMRRVGEGARRELYLSWTDAVANACERYEIVLDNFRCGRYPQHRGITDSMFTAMADVFSAMDRSQQHEEQIVRTVRKRREQISERLHERFL